MDRDTEVFGVSLDGYASNAEFARQLDLPFDLLSDWERTMTPSYGALNEKQTIANRYSYLIDKDGVIVYVQFTGLNEPRDIEGMMDAVDTLYNEQQGQ